MPAFVRTALPAHREDARSHGREAYDGLYDRFAAIPGVERLEWEDRERFLLRLRRGTEAADVRDAARRALRDARRAAEQRG